MIPTGIGRRANPTTLVVATRAILGTNVTKKFSNFCRAPQTPEAVDRHQVAVMNFNLQEHFVKGMIEEHIYRGQVNVWGTKTI
jgi:hypothetical protein